MKHANSILETFEYFCHESSKLITIILSYTVSKLVRFFLRHSVVGNRVANQFPTSTPSGLRPLLFNPQLCQTSSRCGRICQSLSIQTRKPSYRWQTRATWKSAKGCSNSTCLQRCRWRYWPIFIRLAVVACEIPRNSLKIQTYGVQGHTRSSILVSMKSPYVTSY